VRLSPHLLDEVLSQELHGSRVLLMRPRRKARKARCVICKARFFYGALSDRQEKRIQRRPLCGEFHCKKAARSDGNTCVDA